jgi:hypothetical protein
MWGLFDWPKWIDMGNDRSLVPVVARPEDITVLVAGGPGKHSSFVPTFGITKSVTKKIASPELVRGRPIEPTTLPRAESF